jgi:DNA-binding transcriptional LysR family regulator
MRMRATTALSRYATRMVDPEDLAVFVVAASEKTFTAAAKSLHTTQASVSRRVARLEQSLGGTLFDRTNRRTPHLTPLGEITLPYARQLVADLTRFRERARLYSQGKHGVLTIALSEPLAPAVLPTLVRQVRERLPGIGLQFRECAAAEGTVRALLDGEADLGVLSAEFMTDDVDGLTFALIPHQAVGPPRLLGEREVPIEWDDLCQLPLLLPLPRRLIRYPLAHRQLNVVHDAGGSGLLIAMAQAGLGVAILAGTLRYDGLSRRPIAISGVPQRTSLMMIWRNGSPLATPARRLTDDLRRQVANVGPPLLPPESSRGVARSNA